MSECVETSPFTLHGDASAALPQRASDARPVLLFYCQHSLGIGHLTRSFALARALAALFRVVFLNGGPVPAGVPIPSAMEVIDLPPLGMDDGHTVVSRDADHSVDSARARRRALILHAVEASRPAVVLIELFPFGRKKFAGEILALIRAARRQPDGPACIACSLRDILVDARRDQQHFDDRARWLANRYFDVVLVHSDPDFARIEDSFRPRKPLTVALHYTGYVVPARALAAPAARGKHVLVSAGGGIVGFPLFVAGLQAQARLWPEFGLPMRIVAGPFLPEEEWTQLQRFAADLPGVELVRHVPDMAAEMRQARLSISQCGYNTALDIVVAGVPALVVPYVAAGENEQSRRAEALASLHAVRYLPGDALDGPGLTRAIRAALEFVPRPAALSLAGAQTSANLLAAMVMARARASAGTRHSDKGIQHD